MNISYAHLPLQKQEELKLIVDYILSNVPESQIIILYGSYARGDYTEYDQRMEFSKRTLFMSDYDLAIIYKESNHKDVLTRLENAAEEFYKGHHMSYITPIQFIAESVELFNQAINEGRYFFTDVVKEGILLFDSGIYPIAEPKERLNFNEIHILANEYYSDKFERATSFVNLATHAYNDKDYKSSAFLLHQATENYLCAIILCGELYCPKEHNLARLLGHTKRQTRNALKTFQHDSPEDQRLFQLLEDAYIQARYNPQYQVSEHDVFLLLQRIQLLQKKCKKNLCRKNRRVFNNNIMKTSIAHLSKDKQEEINSLLSNIRKEIPDVEFIILFGSYATGDHIEYDQRTEFGLRTFYRSDYDLVVLTAPNYTSCDSTMTELNKIASRFYSGKHFTMSTPIQFLHESVKQFNKSVVEGKYFYRDILKTGILLYDSGNYKLEPILELNLEQILELSKEYYTEKYGRAKEFLIDAKSCCERGSYVQSSFYLHQAAENLLSSIILISSLYSPKGHNLYTILDDTKQFTDKAIEVFSIENEENERLFNLLNAAYIEARYNKDFKVSKEEIEAITLRAEQLRRDAKFFCEEKIKEYQGKIDGK